VISTGISRRKNLNSERKDIGSRIAGSVIASLVLQLIDAMILDGVTPGINPVLGGG
jgi:hypothetical protein